MSNIDDSIPIYRISIPGTHDSGADQLPIIFSQTQTMTVSEQLYSGVRYFDIRCRHFNDDFAIHHGAFYMGKNFNSIMNQVTGFLQLFPTETVLMRIKEEYEPAQNTRTFSQTMQFFYNQYASYFWQFSSTNPNLGQVRGKVVILQDFVGDLFGLPYISFDIQDDYDVKSFDKKKESILNQLNKKPDFSRGVINHLSGTNNGVKIIQFNPSSVAKQTSSFLLDYILNNNPGFVGIIPADFPSETLINSIINVNQYIMNLSHN